jgi:hypothetical protein
MNQFNDLDRLVQQTWELHQAQIQTELVSLLQEKLETHFSVRLNAAIAKIGLTYHYQETGDRAYASFPYHNYEVRIICERGGSLSLQFLQNGDDIESGWLRPQELEKFLLLCLHRIKTDGRPF